MAKVEDIKGILFTVFHAEDQGRSQPSFSLWSYSQES